MNKQKMALLAVIAALVAVFFIFDLGQYLSLEAFNARKDALLAYEAAHPWTTATIFFLIYVAVTALSLPAAAILTLAGGAIFGLWTGLLLVSFASTLGATRAFLASRFLLRDWVQQRYGSSLKTINEGIIREGGFYLFGLRLVPLFPFFLINLVMGLSPLKTRTFYWVSQLGMLPGTIVYVNAGTQLGQIESTAGILSPALLLSFALLGLFPLIARRIMDVLKARRVLARFDKPAQFDRNLIVIGAGSAGLVSSYIAAAVKARVTLIEKHKMGGDCLNTGCVPSKALLKAARTVAEIGKAPHLGIHAGTPEVDFAAVMERVQAVVAKVEPHDSVERYEGLGVECLQGSATILDPWRVQVSGQILSARNIIIATGARPFVPPIPGIEQSGYLTSDTIWSLREKPQRLLVLGGGPIGCELSLAFARLGVTVTQVDRSARILPREDEDAALLVQQSLEKNGVSLQLNSSASCFGSDEQGRYLEIERQGHTERLYYDQVLLAVGRRANTDQLGLERLGIQTRENGTLVTDDSLRTSIPTIHACGDVAGPFQFTHTAAHQAWYAAVNSLFGVLRRFKVDYRVIPWCTFTDPEVARVGLSEQDAREQGIAYEVTRYGIDDLDRAIADGVDEGFVKVLTAPGKDRILGVTIVGHHAGDLLAEFVLAMKHGLGLNKILGTINTYPTLAEANKYAAGQWKRDHAPEKLLAWVARFHTWRRGTGQAGQSRSVEALNSGGR